jgi:DNA-binding SARP family transcriptional activator
MSAGAGRDVGRWPPPRVGLLDGFSLELGDDDPPVGELPRGVQRLVAHLALCRRPARSAIAGELWPDVPEEHAQGSLRSALWRVQKAAPGLVDASAGTLALARGVRVDVWELTVWARRALDPHGGTDEAAVPESALRGELLPGWYDDWVLFERERIEHVRFRALEAMAVGCLQTGRPDEAALASRAALQIEPLHEGANLLLMRACLASGSTVEAVRHYKAYRRRLEQDLGIRPSAQVSQLIAPLLVPTQRQRAAPLSPQVQRR